MEKISVLSMFRDSEQYLSETFERLEALEQNTQGFSFEYFFYENDSTDNTVSILSEWMLSKNGFVQSEVLGRPKFSQSTSADRQFLMSDYRNRLLESCKPLDSAYSLLLDSDVSFSDSLINCYLQYFDDNVAMTTPNILQNIKCKMFDSSKDSYYDSWALIDTDGRLSMTWSSNPFYGTADREKWDKGEAVTVNSAFGGCPLIRSKVLNEIRWDTQGGCEHWHFCEMIRNHGSIIVVPTIIARVEIPPMTFTNELAVISKQKQLFQLLNGF